MRMVWKTMRLRHVGMGFFWACSMLTFRSSILLSGSANTPEYESLVVIVSFVANMTTMLAVAAWVENDPVRIDRLPIWPLPVLVVAGLLLVFAAVFIGGTSVFGGSGRLYGTLIGIAIVGMIEAGIVSSGLSGFWTRAVHGMVIVVAVSSYAILSGNADERILRLVRWRKR